MANPVPRARALKPTVSLTDRVAEALTEEITGGRYKPGEILPSEQVMATSFGVSRTVVREAVARLKTSGLLGTRQGLGVFVVSNRRQSSFQIDHGELEPAEQIVKLVELRMGIETEAAGLAAERRTERDLRDMRKALDKMAEAIESGKVEAGVDADVRFHRAICAATRNPHYLTFTTFLGQFLHENIMISRKRSAKKADRGALAQAEHLAIYEAILARDPEAARAAARRHVENTAHRLADNDSFVEKEEGA